MRPGRHRPARTSDRPHSHARIILHGHRGHSSTLLSPPRWQFARGEADVHGSSSHSRRGTGGSGYPYPLHATRAAIMRPGQGGGDKIFLKKVLSVVSGGAKPETTTPVGRQELQTVGWVEAALHPFAFEACGLGRPKPNCPRARTYHTRHESRWVTAEKPAVQNQTVEAA